MTSSGILSDDKTACGVCACRIQYIQIQNGFETRESKCQFRDPFEKHLKGLVIHVFWDAVFTIASCFCKEKSLWILFVVFDLNAELRRCRYGRTSVQIFLFSAVLGPYPARCNGFSSWTSFYMALCVIWSATETQWKL